MNLEKSKADTLREIEYRIKNNKRRLYNLKRKYLNAFAPTGYKEGTSYNDWDTIHGSRKEWSAEKFYEEKVRLETMIELDEELFKSMSSEVNTEEYLKLLENNWQRVKFLRKVKGFTQEKTAETLKLGLRTVQRIDKNN